jgi:hypothetical protein
MDLARLLGRKQQPQPVLPVLRSDLHQALGRERL